MSIGPFIDWKDLAGSAANHPEWEQNVSVNMWILYSRCQHFIFLKKGIDFACECLLRLQQNKQDVFMLRCIYFSTDLDGHSYD